MVVDSAYSCVSFAQQKSMKCKPEIEIAIGSYLFDKKLVRYSLSCFLAIRPTLPQFTGNMQHAR